MKQLHGIRGERLASLHLLLDSRDEVYRRVRRERISIRFPGVAPQTSTPVMLIKMREMASLGYDLRLTDTTDSHFFKNIRA